jgi:hypothetical protein
MKSMSYLVKSSKAWTLLRKSKDWEVTADDQEQKSRSPPVASNNAHVSMVASCYHLSVAPHIPSPSLFSAASSQPPRQLLARSRCLLTHLRHFSCFFCTRDDHYSLGVYLQCISYSDFFLDEPCMTRITYVRAVAGL